MVILCSHNSAVRKHWHEALGGNIPQQEATSLEVLKSLLGSDETFPLVLLHLSLPGLEGGAGIPVLRKLYPNTKLLVFADKPDDIEGLLLLRQGIYGYCNTYMAATLLARAVKAAREGEVWVGWDLMQRLIRGIAPEASETRESNLVQLESLTDREQEIAHYVAQGASNKRIASSLGITERTVKAHLSTVYKKIGVNDRLQLALLVNSQVA
jgi:DNA-binding NarL/FixJ family response regulator